MSSIITFYSFKGGVGRTMALANIAVLLVKRGLKILVIDWDLDAPGLEDYFQGLKIQKTNNELGLLDLLIDATRTSTHPNWKNYLSTIDLGYQNPLYAIFCGQQDDSYAKKLKQFNWSVFYEEHEGGDFMENLRKDWLDEFDVTLIDSRTGLTDTGGVCTIQLPDILVVVFSTNEQSLRGAKDIIMKAQRGRQKLAFDRMPLLILPLLSRVDARVEVDETQKWLEKIAEAMAPFYTDWLSRHYTPRQVIERTKIPYVAYFSFGEKLPVVTHSISDPDLPGYWYDNIANLIATNFKSIEQILPTVMPSFNSYKVPLLPPFFVPRPNELKWLKEILLSTFLQVEESNIGVPRQVGLHGKSGSGKSVLAAAIAYDDDIRKAFPDGVIWLTFGQHVDVMIKQVEFFQAIEFIQPIRRFIRPFDNWHEGCRCLSEITANYACLVILDDVWSEQHVEAFTRLGRKCRLLVTTRDNKVLEKIDARSCLLDGLPLKEALDLLAKCTDQKVQELSFEASDVVKKCGYLPLALTVVGTLIRAHQFTWHDALDRLQSADLQSLCTRLSEYDPGLLTALEISVEDLSTEAKNAFFDCAVFPKKAAIPEATLQLLWLKNSSDSQVAVSLAQLLVERSLIQRDEKDQYYYLHNFYNDYLTTKTEDLPTLHCRLLNAYQAHCSTGWPSGPNDGYFFQYLLYHLIQAGKHDTLRALLLNYDWLTAKLDATDIFAVIDDYEKALAVDDKSLHGDRSLRLIQQSLKLSRYALSQDRAQLASQLFGRLRGIVDPPDDIRDLVKQLEQQSAKVSWFYPETATLIPPGRKLLEESAKHEGGVHTVAVTPDGHYAISGSWDKTLKLWNLYNGAFVRLFQGHTQPVLAVAVTPDGQRAVSCGSDDLTLRVWELDTGALLHPPFRGHTDRIYVVAVTPDGRCVASGSRDRTIRLWDLKTGQSLQTFQGHTDRIYAVVVTPDGRRIVSGSGDCTIKVWDLETGQSLQTFQGHTTAVCAVAVTPDGRRIVSGSGDCTIKVWDLETGQFRNLLGHTDRVYAVAVTSDGRHIVSGSRDHTLKLWELETGRIIYHFEGHSVGVNAVAVVPDDWYAISGSGDCTLRLWDLKTGIRVPIIGHSYKVYGVAVTPNGCYAISSSFDCTIKLWNVKTGQLERTFEGHTDRVHAVAVTPDGRRIVSGSGDRTIKVWNLETGQLERTLEGHTGWVHAVAVTPDGRRIVSGSGDRTIKVWNLETGQLERTLEGHTDQVHTVAVTPDGRCFVSGSGDCTLKLWDLETGKPLKTLRGHTDQVYAVVVVPPHGRYAVSGSRDCTLKLWDLETGELLNKFSEGRHLDHVNTVAVTPDGQYIVSGSSDRTLKLWDFNKGGLIATFYGDAEITCIGVTNNQKFVAGSSNGAVHLLDIFAQTA